MNTRIEQQVEDATTDLEASDDMTAEEALINLRGAAESYFSAINAKKEVGKEMKEHVAQSWESLKTNVEEPTKTSASKGDLVGKLRRVESSYQEYQDAVTYSKEGKKAAGEEVKAAKEQLQRAIIDSTQLTLPGI